MSLESRRPSPLRQKAIIVVHIYGLPADIDRVVALANTHNIAVIEDSAEAHGQHLDGRTLGSFGTLSTFSFYSNKLITTGEGGMVLSTNAALADSVRSLRNLSFDPQRRFVHESIGWNYRMTAMQAALGLSQLGRMAELLALQARCWTLLPTGNAGMDRGNPTDGNISRLGECLLGVWNPCYPRSINSPPNARWNYCAIKELARAHSFIRFTSNPFLPNMGSLIKNLSPCQSGWENKAFICPMGRT